MPESSASFAAFAEVFEAVLLLGDFVELFEAGLSAVLDVDLPDSDLLLEVEVDLDFVDGLVVEDLLVEDLEVEGLAELRVAGVFSVFEDFVLLAVLGAGLSSDFAAVVFAAVVFAAAVLVMLVFSVSAAAGFVAAGLDSAGLLLADVAVGAATGAEDVGRLFALAGSEVATNAATEATTREVVSKRTRFMAVISL